MTKIKIIKEGYMYPKGKILSVSKSDAKEAIREGIAELINETFVKGVGVIEELEMTPKQLLLE